MLAALSASAPARAAAPRDATYRVDSERTTVGFTVTNLGVARQRWRFDRAWGTIVLDPNGTGGSVDLILDSASVDTGWTVRDRFLRSAPMFDAANFPAGRFRSRHLDYGGAGLVGVDGELTLRGITRPVRLDVRRLQCAARADDGRDGCHADVVGRISRAAFGMDFAYPFVGDDVELDLSVTAVRVRDDGETETP